MRLINIHKPALDFERFFRRLHALVDTGGMKLPPKDLRSTILISMLFTDHPREIRSISPPATLMRGLAVVGKLTRFELPEISSTT